MFEMNKKQKKKTWILYQLGMFVTIFFSDVSVSVVILVKRLCTLWSCISGLDFFSQEASLLALAPIIKNEVTKLQKRKNPDPNTLQLQLFTMKLIVIRVNGNHPDLFISWLPIASSLYTSEKADDMVSINAMLLCKELVALLKVQVLPHLNDIIPPMIVKLSQSLEAIRERYVCCIYYKTQSIYVFSNKTILDCFVCLLDIY